MQRVRKWAFGWKFMNTKGSSPSPSTVHGTLVMGVLSVMSIIRSFLPFAYFCHAFFVPLRTISKLAAFVVWFVVRRVIYIGILIGLMIESIPSSCIENRNHSLGVSLFACICSALFSKASSSTSTHYIYGMYPTVAKYTRHIHSYRVCHKALGHASVV